MSDLQPNSPGIVPWLRLIRAQGVGPATFHKLIQGFGSPEKALGASAGHLASIEGIGPKNSQRISASFDRFDAEGEIRQAEDLGVWLIHMEDPRYPPLLKAIADPPPVLWIKGPLSRQHYLSVAIVGSRHCSIYGQEQAARLAHLLASAGLTIVSGMARGIDSAAHQGALSAKGQTLAVQGCGLARVFPPENKRLFDLICQSGACISELPLQYDPLPENFPARNRIIAGLALGTIVVEAGLRSGALITGRLAMEYNREVMAVPGHIDSPLSKGPHQLLKQGATLIESPEDVIDALGSVTQQLRPFIEPSEPGDGPAGTPNSAPLLKLSASEQQIYEILTRTPQHTDQIVSATNLPAGTVTAHLVALQLKGVAKNVEGNLFVRRQ